MYQDQLSTAPLSPTLPLPVRAVRARRLIALADEGPSTGKALYRPLTVQDDALLVAHAGRLVYAGRYRPQQVPVGVEVEDMGEVTLVPAAINAHTHIQLSHVAGRTLWGQGFVPWLRSLIALLGEPLDPQAMDAALGQMAAGTAHVGDYTGQGMALAAQTALRHHMGCTLFAEWFGFLLPSPASLPLSASQEAQAGPSSSLLQGPLVLEGDIWPPRCRAVLDQVPVEAHVACAPAGHALYSTHENFLRAAHAWCCTHELPFALHLAEFPEETEALVHGRGSLVDLYTPVVLPPQWRAPGLPPVPLARRWGLLGPHTLAVHCVHCDAGDRALLAEAGARVCLCPRSNAHLNVGTASVQDLADAGLLLCLGTDGLSSNLDLDVWKEAIYLHQQDVLPSAALLRLVTRNGAAALLRHDVGALAPGKRARWAVLPSEWESDIG